MKRIMYDTMVTVMLIVTIFGEATIARLVNNNYTREGVVVATHPSNEEVIIIDTIGNERCSHGVCYEESDTVTMTMNNIINDDIIKNVIVNTY